jgi:hypothetical protein
MTFGGTGTINVNSAGTLETLSNSTAPLFGSRILFGLVVGGLQLLSQRLGRFTGTGTLNVNEGGLVETVGLTVIGEGGDGRLTIDGGKLTSTGETIVRTCGGQHG